MGLAESKDNTNTYRKIKNMSLSLTTFFYFFFLIVSGLYTFFFCFGIISCVYQACSLLFILQFCILAVLGALWLNKEKNNGFGLLLAIFVCPYLIHTSIQKPDSLCKIYYKDASIAPHKQARIESYISKDFFDSDRNYHFKEVSIIFGLLEYHRTYIPFDDDLADYTYIYQVNDCDLGF